MSATVERQQLFVAQTGRLVFFGAWSMLFAALFMAYGFVRSSSAVWPPVDVPVLDIRLPLMSTLLVIASSLALIFADRLHSRPLTGLALSLGLAFLAAQTIAAVQLWKSGMTPSTGGAYGTVVYGLCAAHALHVAPGLVALLAGVVTKPRVHTRAFWSAYWHFVAAVWCLLFVALFGV
jgi:heme/copper-type cytochrome/quinol oxidase subunit 3